MPYLGDYIGHLMSEITIARMHGDIEAVRVAELYASHELLRHMPVPHFRLPDIELDIPVAIKQVEEAPAGAPPRGSPKLEQLRTKFDQILTRVLHQRNIRLDPAEKGKLDVLLNEKVDALRGPNELAFDVGRVANELTAVATRTLREIGRPTLFESPATAETFELNLKELVTTEFLRLRTPPPRLLALVTTQEIREAGPAENITRIHLKISEEAFEWTQVESNGQAKRRLVPE
jgi:hypothetical protein